MRMMELFIDKVNSGTLSLVLFGFGGFKLSLIYTDGSDKYAMKGTGPQFRGSVP